MESTEGKLRRQRSERQLLGPYSAIREGSTRRLAYRGNALSPGADSVSDLVFNEKVTSERLRFISNDLRFAHLHIIDNQIFSATIDYMRNLGAHWCNLPLVTLMISSPGEVYAGKTLDYTTDTLPVDLQWFDTGRRVFLAESSQFYLELRLLNCPVDKVFSVYNSFRKERADVTHLSEFQHIEFEGRVGFEENMRIAQGLLSYIVEQVADSCSEPLRYFIGNEGTERALASVQPDCFETLTFKEALTILYKDTDDPRYKEFTLKHFGAWEEVRLSEIVGRNVWLTHFPLLQIPFYHNASKRSEEGVPLAENADLILHGYREVIGSGVRIASPKALSEKARLFNLPPEDYEPYLQTRGFENYASTAGFGLGWQRLVQWLLGLPCIWEATHLPRGHVLPKP